MRGIAFEKKYEEEIRVANYQGAIKIAQEWNGTIKNSGAAVIALANAYNMNFEPKKAVSVILTQVFYMARHSFYSDKDIASGYALLAHFNCAGGFYDKATKAYQIVSEMDTKLYEKTLAERYSCRMNELATSSSFDQKVYDDFKEEVMNYLEKKQNETDQAHFSRASLAHAVAKDNQLALKFEKATEI